MDEEKGNTEHQIVNDKNIVRAMAGILFAMIGYWFSSLTGSNETVNHRIDMVTYQVNEIDRRITVIETELKDKLK